MYDQVWEESEQSHKMVNEASGLVDAMRDPRPK